MKKSTFLSLLAACCAAAPALGADEIETATFEGLLSEPESHLTPADDGSFSSGSFIFNYGGMPEYNFWYGYAFSNETSAEFAGLTDQFRSACGGGHDSETFAVGFPQGLTIEYAGDAPEGVEIPGFYINNSAYAYNSMTHGDSYAKKFGQGDWFKVVIRIFDPADGNSYEDKELCYLADFRSENPEEHYIIRDWTYVDLTRFGKLKSMTFLFESSDSGQWGVNTPTYLCIDDFGAKPEGDISAVAGVSTEDHPTEYYDLTGIRLSTPPAHGIYIERRGDKCVKRLAR